MLHAIIMAGGSGTRFWPKSRRDRPKQLLRLFGDRTMLQQTVDRIRPLIPDDRIIIVTGADQAAMTRAQLPELKPENIVAEPCPRDTAACVGLAAWIVRKRDPDGVMAVVAADHVVEPAETFLATIKAAVEVIEADPTTLITFGIKPTRPETGYGYIERGELLETRNGIAVNRVLRFREKPTRATAKRFLAAGNFAWNSGIFVWKARAILDELGRHRPELAAALARIGDALGTPAERDVIAREYPRMERAPIDKAVMEKAANVRVLEVSYRWNDVGDWRSLAEFLPQDVHGNAIQGDVIIQDTWGSILISDDGGLIAALGVNDIVVVQSGKATLVARRNQLDKLKELVGRLSEKGFESHT